MKRYEICFHRDVVEVQRVVVESADELGVGPEAVAKARGRLSEVGWETLEVERIEYHCAEEVQESRKTKEGE